MSNTPSPILDTKTVKAELSFADVMQKVALEHAKPLGAQLKEMVSLCMRGNRLTTEEYYSMRLYDDEHHSPENKKRFVGLAKSREIWTVLNEINPWMGVMSDKLAYEHLMHGFGIAVPKTLAIAGGAQITTKPAILKDYDAFKSFFEAVTFPLFGKPLDADGSLGTIKLIAYDRANQQLTRHDGSTIELKAFWDELSAHHKDGYLLQDCLSAHDDLAKLCGGGVPTVRIVTLDRGKEPELLKAAIKLTGGNNVADNFWRGGNLIAPVNIDTGVMGKALSAMGPEGELCAVHPNTGEEIEGTVLPLWDQVRDIALTSARLVKDSLIIGFDIAITQTGPVVIEANFDPHLVMIQVAHQEGMMDERMEEAMNYVRQRVRAESQQVKQTLREERRTNAAAMRKALAKKAA